MIGSLLIISLFNSIILPVLWTSTQSQQQPTRHLLPHRCAVRIDGESPRAIFDLIPVSYCLPFHPPLAQLQNAHLPFPHLGFFLLYLLLLFVFILLKLHKRSPIKSHHCKIGSDQYQSLRHPECALYGRVRNITVSEPATFVIKDHQFRQAIHLECNQSWPKTRHHEIGAYFLFRLKLLLNTYYKWLVFRLRVAPGFEVQGLFYNQHFHLPPLLFPVILYHFNLFYAFCLNALHLPQHSLLQCFVDNNCLISISNNHRMS